MLDRYFRPIYVDRFSKVSAAVTHNAGSSHLIPPGTLDPSWIGSGLVGGLSRCSADIHLRFQLTVVGQVPLHLYSSSAGLLLVRSTSFRVEMIYYFRSSSRIFAEKQAPLVQVTWNVI
jgi:hypothetical protein